MQKTIARTALLVCVLDLLIKALFMDRQAVLLPGLLAFDPVRNTGVAFGLFAGVPLMNALLPLVIILLLSLYVRRLPLGRLAALGLGLMIGGAVGNLVDRLLHGAVNDYLRLLFINFPVFNLADICVTVGVFLLGITLLSTPKEAF